MRTLPASRTFENRFHAVKIVATPGSGNGRALETARQIAEALRTSGHRATLDTFDDLTSLRVWAARLDTKFSLLIAVGGDGTQDTAALAAMDHGAPYLSVPYGFGNLFARALGHSDRVDEVIDTLEHGRLVHVDVGVRNGERFLCQKSYGLLADIEDEVGNVGRPRARWRRWLAYYQMAVRCLREMPLGCFRVAVDGRIVARDAAIVTVANVQTYGAWLDLTPAASPVDGWLDVFIMRRTTKSAILANLLRRHFHLRGTDEGTFRCRGRRVSVGDPDHAADELSLIPGLLPVIVSSAKAEALERGLATTEGLSEVA